jgi:hypothetical protein
LYIRDFQWDSGNEDHIAEHAVRPEEAEEACLRAKAFLRSRLGRYAAYGQTEAGRYLVVIFIPLGQGGIRVISARDMETHERRWFKRR